MKLRSLHIYTDAKSDCGFHVYSAKFLVPEISSQDVEMKDFILSKELMFLIEKEMTSQAIEKIKSQNKILEKMDREFERRFLSEEKTIHREGNQKEEVLSVPEQGSPPVADMLRQKPISSDMS